ncbi:MAG TPA: hypothetical protein VIH25_12945 [Steroidobacteraceae bacterium]
MNACCELVNRGAAAWNYKVHVGMIDGRLIALDAASGLLVWEAMTVPHPNPLPQAGEGVDLHRGPLQQAGEGVDPHPAPLRHVGKGD